MQRKLHQGPQQSRYDGTTIWKIVHKNFFNPIKPEVSRWFRSFLKKIAFKLLCSHIVIFPKKNHPSMTERVFYANLFFFFLSLRINPPQVGVTSGIYFIEQHQISKTNLNFHMKVLLKLLLKWNWWWNFTRVCTISPKFEIHFLEFCWEIVFGVASDNCL